MQSSGASVTPARADVAPARDRGLTFPQLWLFLAVALPVLGALVAGLSTVDLSYQLRLGGEILDTGRIPTTDTFTFTAAGASWLNQQWAAQLVLALVGRVGGYAALAIFRALVIGLIFGLILRACRSTGATPRVAALLTIAAFLVSVAALALRPQLLGMLLFAACLVLVTERRMRPGALWLVPAIVAIWANVHGSFFLGPALMGIAWLEDRHDNDPRQRRTLIVTVVTVLATLVNPFVFGVWTYAAGLSTNAGVTERISEWQPTSIRTAVGAAFFVSAVAVAGFLARRSRVAPWPTLLWLAFLFLIGVYAIRGTAWWPLGAAVAVAGLIGPRAVETIAPERPRLLNAAIAGVLVVAGVGLLPWWRPLTADPGNVGPALLTFAPARITDTLRATATPTDRIFEPQPWGSWLEEQVPAPRYAVDSRIELFPPAVWDDVSAVTAGRDDWRAILDRWGVTIVVTDTTTSGDLATRLSADPGWRRILDDADGSVFVKADRPA